MPPICNICADDKINFNHKCATCKKCVCNYCYIKISKLSIEDTGEDLILNNYKCCFCNTFNIKTIEDIESETTTLFLKQKIYENENVYQLGRKVNIENENLKLEIKELKTKNNNVIELQKKNAKLLMEISNLNLLLKEKPNDLVIKIYNDFKSKNRKTIKLDELLKFS